MWITVLVTSRDVVLPGEFTVIDQYEAINGYLHTQRKHIVYCNDVSYLRQLLTNNPQVYRFFISYN